MNTVPQSKSRIHGDNKDYRKIVQRRGLVGAANDTKWDELIDAIRKMEGWRPSYRTKYIDGGISDWDVEWFYHLPFPLISVEWMDIGLHQLLSHNKIAENKAIDHTEEIVTIVNRIGFEYEVKADVLRLWGYLPKSYEDFPPKSA